MAVEPIMQPPDPWNNMVGVEALELARKELTSQADQLVKNTVRTAENRSDGRDRSTAATLVQ